MRTPLVTALLPLAAMPLLLLVGCSSKPQRVTLDNPLPQHPGYELKVGYVPPARGGAALDAGGLQHTLRARTDSVAAIDCVLAPLSAQALCEEPSQR